MASYRLNSAIWGNLSDPNTTGSMSVNGAAVWGALTFVLDRAQTLNKVRLFMGRTGTPAASEYRLEVYSTSGDGSPLSSLATASDPASVGNNVWIEWGGLSQSLNAHTMYAVVLKNLNAAPTTNFFQVNHLVGGAPVFVAGAPNSWGWHTIRSANSGSTWGVSSNSASSLRLEFSDGTFAGLPLEGTINSQQVFGNRESGVLFTTPNTELNVRGAAMAVLRNGTPTGRPRYRVYRVSDNALLATTADVAQTILIGASSNPWLPLFFEPVTTLPADTPLRLVLSETTNSDVSTNRYQHRSFITENDANSKTLCGNYQHTLSTDGGSSWADTDTGIVPFALILDFPGANPVPILPAYSSTLRGRYRRGHLPQGLGRL